MIKLLIADDDPVSRKLLEKHSRDWKFKVYTAINGVEAFNILKKEKINIAILDWMMPEMTGIEICRKLRKQKSEEYQYIILLTSRNHPEDIITGLSNGADDYITKPFNTKELEARIKIGKRIIDLQRQLLRAQEKLHEIAIHDSLTTLYNRGEILKNLEEKFIQTKRENQPLGTIMLDIDHFKRINDEHGHQTGDRVLSELARRLKSGLRPYDRVGRYGGEEFLIVLPNCNEKTTLLIAERIRKKIAGSGFKTSKGNLDVSVSLGCAVTDHRAGSSPEDILQRSDIALYKAKNDGRNRVCLN
jgi:two-component system cell cycle response regulator